ncbi:MAG TPA: redoxin domain-containing protein [Thermoanaerobaculia bacterium]|jgi:tetratricopeptide (TPR) repeat protein
MKRTLLAVAFLFVLEASADEASLREALQQLDHDRVIREVAAMKEPSPQARAFYAYALHRAGTTAHATAVAEKLRADHPDDPWGWYAMLAVTRTGEDKGTGETMLRLAGDHPDEEMVRLQALALAGAKKSDAALALLAKQSRTPRMILARANVLSMWANVSPPEVGELANEVLAMLPDHTEALVIRGDFDVEHGRTAEAIRLYERAVPNSPSISLHRGYWTALRKDKSLAPERMRELLEADQQLLIKQRGETPAVLHALSAHYEVYGEPEKAREYGERVLREAPESLYAGRVLSARLYEEDETPEATERMKKAAEQILAWPHPLDAMLLAQAHQSLFLGMRDDPAAPVEALLRHAHGMKPLASRSPAVVFVQPALALADRGVHLDEAERFAREGLAAADAYFDGVRKRMYGRDVDIEKNLRSQRGAFHEALGWVLFQRGRFPEAEEELRKAWQLNPNSAMTAHRLARYLESQRLFDEAEETYRTGMLLQTPGKNPNGTALKALYEKRRGSLDGYDTYLASVQNAEAIQRRQTILKARLRGRAAPPFTLKTLDGKTMSIADLKGKVAVINFWGIWCGWCVKEMPDYQKLTEKYAGSRDVVILTINNDESVDKVKKWMAEKKYAFPVLLDESFATRHVRVFPTTWFIDAAGQLAFEQKGWSEKLVEEFSWRIEALR